MTPQQAFDLMNFSINHRGNQTQNIPLTMIDEHIQIKVPFSYNPPIHFLTQTLEINCIHIYADEIHIGIV